MPPKSPCYAALALLAPTYALAQSSAEFDSVLARYGQINTIAGSGARDDCNGWFSFYEGGAATAADLSRPHMAIADAEGNVFIADKEGFAIRKVDTAGVIHTVAGNGSFGVPPASGAATEHPIWSPNGLYLLPDGTFYFLTLNDLCNRRPAEVIAGGRIHKVTPDGARTTVIDDPSLLGGRGLYVSPDESMIVYCSGTVLRQWTEADGVTTLASGFVSLGNIDREAAGTFLVTDRFGSRVWRVDEEGNKTHVAGTGAGGNGISGQLATLTNLDQVRGVACLDTGGYFLCTHERSQVWYVDTAGYIWLFVDGAKPGNNHGGDGQPVSTPGEKIDEPRSVTLAPNGDLLIVESDVGYVRRVTNITTEPRITDLEFDSATGFRLEWTSHREAEYLLLRSEDGAEWSSSDPIPGGNSSTTTATDEIDSPTALYRVVETDS